MFLRTSSQDSFGCAYRLHFVHIKV